MKLIKKNDPHLLLVPSVHFGVPYKKRSKKIVSKIFLNEINKKSLLHLLFVPGVHFEFQKTSPYIKKKLMKSVDKSHDPYDRYI